mgnify:CR=1 FL=1
MTKGRAPEGCYHLGLSLGQYEGHRPSTVVLHACRHIDFLPCELWRYLGLQKTTKAALRKDKANILAWVNEHYADTIHERYGRPFARVIVD